MPSIKIALPAQTGNVGRVQIGQHLKTTHENIDVLRVFKTIITKT
jgi:hypothetical protein